MGLKIEAKCDFCSKPAIADGKIKNGGWAYLCKDHLRIMGYPLSEYLVTYIDGRDNKPTKLSEV